MTFRLDLLFALCLLSLYNANGNPLQAPRESKIVGFSWSNCGAAGDPLHFDSVSLSPDPVVLPGDVTVGISVTLTKPFPPDVTVIVVMQKKILSFWIEVPCEHNVGSCVYHDICTNHTGANPTSTKANPNFFEKFFAGKPCPPLPPGTYSMSNVVEHISKSLPAGAAGDFRIAINPLSIAAGQLGCILMELNLQ